MDPSAEEHLNEPPGLFQPWERQREFHKEGREYRIRLYPDGKGGMARAYAATFHVDITTVGGRWCADYEEVE